MRLKTTNVLIVIFSFLMVIALIIAVYPYLDKEEGDLTVHWSMPKGLRLKDMKEGDSVEFSYSCDVNISVYLLTDEQADKIRNPDFGQTSIPDPVMTGKEGTGRIRIQEKGDYELLFWNPSFRTDQSVHFSVKVMKPKNDITMSLSGGSLFLFCGGMVVYLLISRKKE